MVQKLIEPQQIIIRIDPFTKFFLQLARKDDIRNICIQKASSLVIQSDFPFDGTRGEPVNPKFFFGSFCFGLLSMLTTPALAALSATGTISTSQTSAPFNYTISLNNTGDTNIGTLWFSWIPGYGFMSEAPTNISRPTGWTGFSLLEFGGYSLELYNITGSAIAPGGSATFGFTSNLSPTQMAGDAIFGNKVTTSFVYIGFPETDPGYQFDLTVVPEPASILSIGFAGFLLLAFRYIHQRRQLGC